MAKSINGEMRIVLNFPVPVRQESDNTISIPVQSFDVPALSNEWRDEIIRRFGEVEGERFIMETTERVNREMILKSIY